MLTSLLRLLPQMLRQVGDTDELREQAVFVAWSAVVGRQVRMVTAPVRLERKTLIIAVLDSTWRTQLKNVSRHALFTLNSLLGAPVVTAIDFVINPELIDRTHSESPEISFIAPEEQVLPLQEQAAMIANEEVRAAFLRAAGKCLERRAK